VLVTGAKFDLSRLLDRVSDLPAFPVVIEQATSLANDPQSSASDLAKVIQNDTALTAKILRITNSPFYGMSREISTVKDAVVVMGFSAVRSLSVAMSAMRTLRTSDGPFFSEEIFWMHSMCCAMVAQRLSKEASLHMDDAFTAGLLHDVGKLTLHKYAPEPFTAVLTAQAQAATISCEIEMKLLNTTHAELGRKLCERWQLPPSLAAAIGGHHQWRPRQVQSKLAALCSVADYICWHHNAKSAIMEGKPAVSEQTLQILGAPPPAIVKTNSEYKEIQREARSIMRSVGS